MSDRIKSLALLLFGFAVITSGCMRYFNEPDGEKGLWFGLVMGGGALLSSFLVICGKRRLGLGVAWASVFFVGGWFIYEALIHKGLAIAETRQLVIIGVTLLIAIVLSRPAPVEPAGSPS